MWAAIASVLTFSSSTCDMQMTCGLMKTEKRLRSQITSQCRIFKLKQKIEKKGCQFYEIRKEARRGLTSIEKFTSSTRRSRTLLEKIISIICMDPRVCTFSNNSNRMNPSEHFSMIWQWIHATGVLFPTCLTK